MKQNDIYDAEQQYLAQEEAENDIFYLLESAAWNIDVANDFINNNTITKSQPFIENAQIYISKAINLLSKDK